MAAFFVYEGMQTKFGRSLASDKSRDAQLRDRTFLPFVETPMYFRSILSGTLAILLLCPARSSRPDDRVGLLNVIKPDAAESGLSLPGSACRSCSAARRSRPATSSSRRPAIRASPRSKSRSARCTARSRNSTSRSCRCRSRCARCRKTTSSASRSWSRRRRTPARRPTARRRRQRRAAPDDQRLAGRRRRPGGRPGRSRRRRPTEPEVWSTTAAATRQPSVGHQWRGRPGAAEGLRHDHLRRQGQCDRRQRRRPDRRSRPCAGAAGSRPYGRQSPTAAASQRQADGTVVAALPATDDPEELYRNSYEFILSGDYGTAEDGFRNHISRFPADAKAADAHFWLGEALLGQKKYRDAAETFLVGQQGIPVVQEGARHAAEARRVARRP